MLEVIENIGAGEGNRTLVFSLEGCCSTIELHPRLMDHLTCHADGLNRPAPAGTPTNSLVPSALSAIPALNTGGFAAYTKVSTTNERR